MTKFKRRCSFPQYLLMKPVRQRVKIWMQCDAATRYMYDINIYAGKERALPIGF